jgi:predicted short-subunit dehydrogenase-like oxidoreductase (DUF2520 family)
VRGGLAGLPDLFHPLPTGISMRELERRPPPPSPRPDAELGAVAIRGAGRLGTVLAAALRDAGLTVGGPLRRGQPTDPASEVVLLCVPDAEIAAAAAAEPPGPLVAHCSGATGLEVLGGRRGLSLHPLMTVADASSPAILRGAGAAVDGSDAGALAVAERLARAAGLQPVHVAAEDRAAYHAAASIAANFLVTVEGAAERLAAGAGVERERLVPLVRAAVDNWAALGPRGALTGPVARGDEATVARQRAAVAQRAPDLLALFDALTDATRVLAGTEAVAC